MLRHAIFALVLVGAAFAGGAAINGPGLAWLQRTFTGGPSIIVDGSQDRAAARKARPGAAARNSPLPADLVHRPGPASQIAAAPSLPPPPMDPPPSDLLGPAPAPASAEPARLATGPTPVDPLPPLELPPERTPAPKSDPVARLASTIAPDAPAAPPSSSQGRDWTELRRKMKALGVARYRIEAEAEGRVRFSCVIPVDGLRAVGHSFEAEGDDEPQAVEAALRRIALWRATEAK